LSVSLEKEGPRVPSHPIAGLSGVMVVDKPADISSAGVVRILKKWCNAKKVGHAGTLDPFATGILVCCINRATRLADFFLKGDKTYRAEMILGVATDTQDATGRTLSQCDPMAVSMDEIQAAFRGFTGEIDQQPPVYSALKHNGVPLYKLARKGKPVQKPPRSVTVSRMEILDVQLPVICFEVTCSAGTYVRTLCADIGNTLGCGGHLKALRRIGSSGFSIDEAASLPKLEALARSGRLSGRLIGMADALRGMPEIVADDGLKNDIITGKPLGDSVLSGVSKKIPMGFFKAVDGNRRLVAVLNRKKDLDTYEYRCVFPE